MNWLYNNYSDMFNLLSKTIILQQKLMWGYKQEFILNGLLDKQENQETYLKLFRKLTGQSYIFTILYVGNGWCLICEQSGVHLYKLPIMQYSQFDIFSCPKEYNEIEFQKNISKYWNQKYDKLSFFLNQLETTQNRFNIPIEFSKIIGYNNHNQLIGSELVQRLYSDININVFNKNPEFVTSQDIQNVFVKIS